MNNKVHSAGIFVALLLAVAPAVAGQSPSAHSIDHVSPAQKTYPPLSSLTSFKPRAEFTTRLGTERSIGGVEVWSPLSQNSNSLWYGDLRLMGDSQDNSEFNIGIGRRHLTNHGTAVLGLHGWLDRRQTERGSVFYQITGGYEYLSEPFDVRVNAYLPFDQEESYFAGAASGPYLAGTGIFYNTAGRLIERPMSGTDVEFTVPVPLLQDKVDSFRASAGAFVFSGDGVETLAGGRLRTTVALTSDIDVGARLERDNQRGSQGFLDATLRFPLGSKASHRTLGIRSRMDESPVRDVDIITGGAKSGGTPTPVLNTASGAAQRVFHVDNTAAGGGDGSLANPFNTLAAADTAASGVGDIIYINRGDGTTTGMDTGITLDQTGQTIIGSGSAFVYDGSRFTAPSGSNFTGTLLKAATVAPVITNTAGDGVYVTANNALLTGFRVENAFDNGIDIDNADNVTVRNLTLNNNGYNGLYAGFAGLIDTLTIDTVTANGNNSGGIIVQVFDTGTMINTVTFNDITTIGNQNNGLGIYAYTGSKIGTVSLSDITANDSVSSLGFLVQVHGTGSEIATITANDITTSHNQQQGIYIIAQSDGVIGNASLSDITSTGNIRDGIYLGSSGSGSMTATLTDATLSGNGQEGLEVTSSGTSSMSLSVSNITSTGNATNGVYVNDDTTGSYVVDLGGGTLSSAGNNRIFGNTGRELRVDLDGGQLKAENNWWGVAGGLLAGEMTLEAASTVDADPWKLSDPGP